MAASRGMYDACCPASVSVRRVKNLDVDQIATASGGEGAALRTIFQYFTVCQQTRPLLRTVANNLIRLAERAVGESFFRGLLKPAIPYYLQIFLAISYWLTLSQN